MVNAQQWLDKNYPLMVRRNVKEIKVNLLFRKLEGQFKLEEFANLEKLYCSGNELTRIEIINCQKLKKIDCGNNQITSFVITNCPNLVKLYLNNNYLTNLNFLTNLNAEKLESLNLSSNNFRGQELASFDCFVNLKRLLIGNSQSKEIVQGVYNRFKDSLEPLKNLNKLEWLDISDTDLDSGLEYLPDSVNSLHCSTLVRSGSKVKVVAEELRRTVSLFSWMLPSERSKVVKLGHFSNKEIKKWKRNNYHLVEMTERSEAETSSAHQVVDSTFSTI